ncbi:uncharacterized protein LOC120355409, partial [Nilaparvata lugens]|uniref:uncharacterized protein LOC120355409 n=1 Tax=Nilaparvata lugens TaxID=108931 RepID=UPI00193D3388
KTAVNSPGQEFVGSTLEEQQRFAAQQNGQLESPHIQRDAALCLEMVDRRVPLRPLRCRHLPSLLPAVRRLPLTGGRQMLEILGIEMHRANATDSLSRGELTAFTGGFWVLGVERRIRTTVVILET